MAGKKGKTTPVEVKTKDDELMAKIAKAKKTTKAEVVSDAMQTLVAESKVPEPRDTYIDLADAIKETAPGAGKDPFDAMLKMMLLREFGGGKKSADDLDLNKILAFSAIRSMMQPDPMLMMAMQKGQGDESDNKLINQMMQQQAQNQQMLMTMLFGKRMDSMQEEIKGGKAEMAQTLAATLGNIDARLSQVSQQQKATLAEELDHYSTVRKAMLDFAEAEGMKKEQIVDSKGDIKWAPIANKLLKIGETIAEKMPTRTPAPKAVAPMQVPQGTPAGVPVDLPPAPITMTSETEIPGAPPGLTKGEIAEAAAEVAGVKAPEPKAKIVKKSKK